MQIGGFVKNSFVDYPHKIASVIFTVGCNMNCWYCHNSHLLKGKQQNKVREDEIFEFLSSHKAFIDAVVISGGEPTLQPDLIKFISKVKKLGYLVKLDTNGTKSEVLKALIEAKLVDYVAMDIKASKKNYKQVCGIEFNNEIQKSIEILLQGKVDYEFRTTYVPDLNLTDLKAILQIIKGSKNYSLQKYRQVEYNPINKPEKTREEHFLAIEEVKKVIPNAVLKGVD